MELHELKDAREAYELAAGHIAEAIGRALEEKDACVLGIVGGRSTSGMLTALEGQLATKRFKTGHLHVFWLDERISDDKNYVGALPYLERLATRMRVSWYPFESTDKKGLMAEMPGIEMKLRALGGFDVIMTSAGEDGHVASLFPNNPAVSVHGQTYVVVENAPKAPSLRVSVSPDMLIAPDSFLMFIGPEKKDAFTWFNEPTVGEEECPVKILLRSPRLHVYVAK